MNVYYSNRRVWVDFEKIWRSLNEFLLLILAYFKDSDGVFAADFGEIQCVCCCGDGFCCCSSLIPATFGVSGAIWGWTVVVEAVI